MTESAAVAVVEPEAAHPVPVGPGVVRPVGTTNEIRQNFDAYQELCKSLLVESDHQRIGSREFKKKSAYRKLAVAFGVSCEIVDRRYERDENGGIVRAEFVVRATAPNGRYMEGWGACEITESRFEKADGRQKVGHDIPATAETRAKNRACSDLFGMGEVSAEEMTTRAVVEDDPDVLFRGIGWASRSEHDDVKNEVVGLLRKAKKDQQATFKAWREGAGIDFAPLTRPQAVAVRQKLVEIGVIADDEPDAPGYVDASGRVHVPDDTVDDAEVVEDHPGAGAEPERSSK